MARRKKLFLLIGIVLIVGLFTGHNIVKNRTTAAKSPAKSTIMRTPINWRKSSEKVAYPNVTHDPNLWIRVSLKKQHLYLINHQHVLYTMYVSTGLPTANHHTPRGTYHVQAERGKYFYSAAVNEGAYYWVSWLNHGEYLFHSTPVNAQGHFIKSDAADLGKKPSSHGCVHLSLADSKWLYQHIHYGTKVVIE
ncbi:L,D-transpeptidase [Lactiplantibacillus sp. WILCCON 0030]|uniref:L,D-transpeptidase n=1 Tax=Lactiplantibacillus brownii TaxID=3069269 RepID=A0ABU1ABU5_9LACO|nr:L,D-transpeptidase [Lactiplantibacillus brownii]MDQ7938447.1 L,D-transpeptidase [Lactiplantibacillus brownii]